jgi:argonaute-like protein implicated in RNA metabolism and viral defense
MKKAYTVYGSEDGIIGIYSNFKKAYAEALDYSCSGDASKVNLTYSQAVKSKNIVTIKDKNNPYDTTAEIQLFIVNQ